MNRISWYDAAEYCNWLSKQEGLPESEWSYEMNRDRVGLVSNVVGLALGMFGTQRVGAFYSERNLTPAPNCLKRTGYRMPTEAEWEFACRAGTTTRYPHGESGDLLVKYVWYNLNALGESHPVGKLRPNNLGLFDMLGNDWEWCHDTYKPYGKLDDGRVRDDLGDSTGLNYGELAVVRGGAFGDLPWSLRSANRLGVLPTRRIVYHTFRPARTMP